MKEFLESSLRQSVLIEKNNTLYDMLPLSFRGRYIIYDVKTNDFHWIAIQPKADIGLVILRKDWAKIQKDSTINCAIFLNTSTFYIKERLLEEGIPFVIKNKQIYLPFIGCLISQSNIRNISPVNNISYLTQKLILTAIYEKWHNVTVSQAAEKLNISKMSAVRCFDEIEFFNVDILNMKGKSRAITIPSDIKSLWEQIQPILRNPVIKRFELQEDIALEKNAGISALCEYSLLSDNYYPTYAITKKEIATTGIKKLQPSFYGDDIGCVVLELGYFIDFNNKHLQDPLSVILSLTNAEKQDERIEISVNEMLEEYVW